MNQPSTLSGQVCCYCGRPNCFQREENIFCPHCGKTEVVLASVFAKENSQFANRFYSFKDPEKKKDHTPNVTKVPLDQYLAKKTPEKFIDDSLDQVAIESILITKHEKINTEKLLQLEIQALGRILTWCIVIIGGYCLLHPFTKDNKWLTAVLIIPLFWAHFCGGLAIGDYVKAHLQETGLKENKCREFGSWATAWFYFGSCIAYYIFA